MTAQQKDILAASEQDISTALGRLMEPTMHNLQGIREAREAVTKAQNAVNTLLVGERTA
jgi:hypothetical protein